jgi:hypothetical protein
MAITGDDFILLDEHLNIEKISKTKISVDESS